MRFRGCQNNQDRGVHDCRDGFRLCVALVFNRYAGLLRPQSGRFDVQDIDKMPGTLPSGCDLLVKLVGSRLIVACLPG